VNLLTELSWLFPIENKMEAETYYQMTVKAGSPMNTCFAIDI